MSSLIRQSKLIENCTSSISYDEQVQSASTAIDEQCYEIIDETPQVIIIPNIMQITDPVLVDILAWQFHVDFYDPTRDLEFRKNLVQKSVSWHRRKGTYDLVREVLDTYWPGGAMLLEWFDYFDPLPPTLNPTTPPAVPYPTIESPPLPPLVSSWHDRYRFRIYIDENIIDPADEAAVLELVDRYKPISRWCEGVFRAEVSDLNIGWAGAMLRFIYRESSWDYVPPTKPPPT